MQIEELLKQIKELEKSNQQLQETNQKLKEKLKKQNKRGRIKTTKKQIVEYWSSRQDECGLSVDWAEAKIRCWRCGYEKTYKSVTSSQIALVEKMSHQI